MATRILGYNTEEEFRNNANRFRQLKNFDAYHQKLNPAVTYVEDKERVQPIKDTFARKLNDGRYAIIEYEGPNLLETVEQEVMGAV